MGLNSTPKGNVQPINNNYGIKISVNKTGVLLAYNNTYTNNTIFVLF